MRKLEVIESEPPTDADERRPDQIGEDRQASAAAPHPNPLLGKESGKRVAVVDAE
jgi:hypothetical protein